MHSRAVAAFQTTWRRANCQNSISILTIASKRTCPNFRLSRLSGATLGDTRSLSTATILRMDRELSESSSGNQSGQTTSAIGTAPPPEPDTRLSNARTEQQLESASLADADPLVPEHGPIDSQIISRNMTQPPDDIPEPSDKDRYYGPVDLSFKPIPSLPPPVSGWPTPWAEKVDIEQYLLPLYGRGWGISFKLSKLKGHANASKDDQPKAKPLGPQRSTAFLVVEYEFDDYQNAADFVTNVATIAITEDHHPRTVTIMNAAYPTVSLTVQTDSAKRPMWDQPLRRKIAGITLRDLRFAILVETLYSDSYGQGRDHKRLIRPLEHRPQWPKYIRTLRKNSLDRPPSPESPAPSSKDKNLKTGRTSQDEVAAQPETPLVCNTCGMNHSSENCPLNEPFSSCPNCGGSHWLVDCPRAQSDQASAM